VDIHFVLLRSSLMWPNVVSLSVPECGSDRSNRGQSIKATGGSRSK